MSELTICVGLMAAAYACGSVSFARLFARTVANVDITSIGTGNPGAANVWRTVGKPWGLLTWVGDMVKVLVPVAVGKTLGIQQAALLAVIGSCGVVGHAFPVWHRFKGGKGAASLGGIVLYLLPRIFPLVIVLWFAVQKINPRSRTILLAATVVYFCALWVLYQEQFSNAVVVTGILMAVGVAINLPLFVGTARGRRAGGTHR